MGTHVIKLPSGAKIEMRDIRLKEENLLAKLANASSVKQNKILKDIIQSCTVGIVDHGTVYEKMNSNMSWNDALQGDLFAALVGLARISYNNDSSHTFKLKHCNKIFDYEIDLEKDLFIQELPKESIEKILAKENFETQIDGKKVTFKIPMVRDQEKAQRLEDQFPSRKITAGLRSLIVEVEGVNNNHIMSWLDGVSNKGTSKYPGLESEDLEKLRDNFDIVNCGIDDEIDAICPHCEEEFVARVPLDGGLLNPGKSIQERKKQRRQEQKAKRRRGMVISEDTEKKTS